MYDFTLVSTELRNGYEPRQCRILKRLASEILDDLALVEIEPPLPGEVYGEKRSVRRLVLGARHEGETLFPVTRLPMAVYICVVNDVPEEPPDSIRSEDLRIVDFGEIQPIPKS